MLETSKSAKNADFLTETDIVSLYWPSLQGIVPESSRGGGGGGLHMHGAGGVDAPPPPPPPQR